MAKIPRQREQSAKGEADTEKPMTKAEAPQAMERFKTLARKLLAVPRAAIEEEERKFRQKRTPTRKRRKAG